MQRILVTERPNLADAAAEHELEYVAGEGVTGWDESAYYQFTMVEIAEDFLAPAEACKITGLLASSAPSIMARICSRLLTLNAGTPYSCSAA